MKVLLWQMKHTREFDRLILWDGQYTYWDDDMRPSTGYTKIRFKWCSEPMACRFVYVGEYN